MRRAVARLRRRLGRRGAILLVIAAGWMYFGLGVVFAPTRDTVTVLAPVTDVVPLDALGGLWVVCALVAGAFAWAPAGADRYGFAAVVGPPIVWAAAYMIAWSTGETGRAWPSGGTWLTWVGVVIIIVGWREPPTQSTGVPDADI